MFDNNMGFTTDLKEGEEEELFVAEKLNQFYGYSFHKNEDKKGVDLICAEAGTSAEVKKDRMCFNTGNYAFEFTCNNKPSGISLHSDLWVQAHEKGFELYNRKELLSFVKENYDRVVKGGDGWRSEMWLIKRETILPLAIYIYNKEKDESISLHEQSK